MKELQPHEQRVVDEQQELQIKFNALFIFLEKGQPKFINDDNWRLLNWQFNAMQIYNDILKQRISLFS